MSIFLSPSIDELNSAAQNAVQNIKRRLDNYITTGKNVPKDTGALQNSGRKNLNFSIVGLDFSIVLHFDVDYAEEVEKRTGFFIKMQDYVKRVIKQEFEYYLSKWNVIVIL